MEKVSELHSTTQKEEIEFMHRCISFVAVSSVPQAEEVSLDEQALVNAENAQRLGGHITHRLSVPGHTRRYDTLAEIAVDVPAYADLRQIIDAKAADVLLAYTPDRLARSPALLLDIAQKCWRAGIALYINSMPPHTLDPQAQANSLSQQFLLAFAGVQAGGEVTTLQIRHRFGMAARVKRKGLFPGMVPYGYQEEFVSRETVRIVPDAQTAPTVRWILVDLYVGQGMGTGKIAEILNGRGVVTPARRRGQLYGDKRSNHANVDTWTSIMVRQLVERAARYAGYIELNKRGDREYIIIRGEYEPLISDEELAAVEAERGRRTQGPNAVYALSRLCRCRCGGVMHVYRFRDTLASGAPVEYMYLLCNRCGQRVRYETVVQGLIAAFDAVEDDADFVQRKRAGQAEQEQKLLAQLDSMDGQLRQVGEAIGRLLDALEDASMPHDQIAERLKRRQTERQQVESTRTQVQKELDQLRFQPDPAAQIQSLRAGAALLQSGAEPAEINRQLRNLLDYVIVDANGQVTLYL